MIVASTIVPARSKSRCSINNSCTTSKIGLRQTVLLKQMTEAQDRRLVGNLVIVQLHASEAAHRLTVVDRVFSLRIRQIEPLLHEVNPKHPLKIMRLSAQLAQVVVGLDQLQNPPPRDDPIHLRQKTLAARHLALSAPSRGCKRLLLLHKNYPPALFYHLRVIFAELP